MRGTPSATLELEI